MDITEYKRSNPEEPGLIALISSGETSASGRRVYDFLFRRLAQPTRIAILETPAGFQPNSAQVAEKVGSFLFRHLQNFHPTISIIPARKRNTPHSPDDESIISPIRQAGVIFLGPGSPSYTVRQLQGSLAWHTILARHRRGATLVLASAAALAIGSHTLPVYEIYKAGDDLHWLPGLDFFGAYGLSLVFISHWNNREGGAELDTSRCYMGQARFEQLLTMLPADTNIIGIDEHTALIIDLVQKNCRVMGRGTITLLRQKEELRFSSGESFSIEELGTFSGTAPENDLPSHVWESVLEAEEKEKTAVEPPDKVLFLLRTREAARARGDWETADTLRKQILNLGWQVKDTKDGPQLIPS